MNFELPEHITMMQDMLRRFVADEMPRQKALEWDKTNHFPREVHKKLAELGVMGLTIPEEYGGSGRDILAATIVIEELSRRSMSVSTGYIMASFYAGMNLLECASEAQKRELLPRVVSGDLLFAYGWTEPDVGADLASVKTNAYRDGEDVVVNGAKRFCSGAGVCDYIYTLLRTGPADERKRNLSIILIPPDTPGVTIEAMDALGHKGVGTTDVVFEDVRVPAANIVGGEAGWNKGWGMISGSGLDVEKIEVAAMGLGVAGAAVEDAWNYAEQRQQFGKTISNYQAIRHKLADVQTQLRAARLFTYYAAARADQDVPNAVETSMAKLFVTESAKAIALECQTIMGAYGYIKEFDMERYVRDALLLPIIGGSSSVQRNNISSWMGLAKQAS